MPAYRIPVEFAVRATVTIDAASHEEAVVDAYASDLPACADWEPVDQTYRVIGEEWHMANLDAIDDMGRSAARH